MPRPIVLPAEATATLRIRPDPDHPGGLQLIFETSDGRCFGHDMTAGEIRELRRHLDWALEPLPRDRIN
jgi:hypothetical protein